VQTSDSPETQYRYRGLWSPHIKVFLEILHEEDKHDLLIEVRLCVTAVCARTGVNSALRC
jgi:hypothetical protein